MILATPAAFPYASYSGWCEQGGQKVTVAGQQSTTYTQQSYPNFTASGSGPHVTVYLTGTTTKATIYSDNAGTPLGNPFNCSATSQYQFFAADGFYDLVFSGTGISAFTIAGIQIRGSFNVKSCGAKGDNSSNDSGAIATCIAEAAAVNAPVYFPAGTYLSCNATPSIPSGGNVLVYGDGPQSSMLSPYGGAASCSGANYALLKLVTTGAVSMQNMGFDGQQSGQFASSNICIGGAGACGTAGSISNSSVPASVTIDHIYNANGQITGITCQPCQNVTVTNSTFSHDWWYGISISDASTTASPSYLHNYTLTGNTFIDEPFGISFGFHIDTISVSGSNLFQGSAMFFQQTPSAKATVSGNAWNGVPDQGCILVGGPTSCGSFATYAPIYIEGGSDITIGVNSFTNINGPASVITSVGSYLQIPLSTGTKMDLPVNRVHVDGVTITNSSSALPIGMRTVSNGDNPASGTDIVVKNAHLVNVNACPFIGGAVGFDMSNNTCDTAQNGGYSIGSDINGAVKGNYCRNCNASGGTTYATGTLSATNGNNLLTGSGTTWTSAMVEGGITIQGTTYTILSRASNTSVTLSSPFVGTTGSGLAYSLYYGGGGAYSGLLMNGSTSQVQVNGNVFQNDSGTSLFGAIEDTTALGTVNTVNSGGNTAVTWETGQQFNASWTGVFLLNGNPYPISSVNSATSITLTGNAGTLTGAYYTVPGANGITYDDTNVCSGACGYGIYAYPPSVAPTLASCGSGASINANSTNGHGIISPGTGGITACTILFSGNGFLMPTPSCSFLASNQQTFNTGPGTSGTQFVLNTSASLSTQNLIYSCTGTQVDQGIYPYPYFWK